MREMRIEEMRIEEARMEEMRSQEALRESVWTSPRALRFGVLLAVESALGVFLVMFAWNLVRTINFVLETTGQGYYDATVECAVLGAGALAWIGILIVMLFTSWTASAPNG